MNIAVQSHLAMNYYEHYVCNINLEICNICLFCCATVNMCTFLKKKWCHIVAHNNTSQHKPSFKPAGITQNVLTLHNSHDKNMYRDIKWQL